jgi:hypothetical protein
MDAKNTMLHFMAQSGVWPVAHAKSLAAFYVALDLHPRKLQLNGKRALLLYQSRVRRKWFDAFKRDEGFNIELIQDTLLHSFAEDINNQIVFREIEQVWCPYSPESEPCADGCPISLAPPPTSPLCTLTFRHCFLPNLSPSANLPLCYSPC